MRISSYKILLKGDMLPRPNPVPVQGIHNQFIVKVNNLISLYRDKDAWFRYLIILPLI